MTVTTNAYQGIIVKNNGSLDFSLITKNSRKNEQLSEFSLAD